MKDWQAALIGPEANFRDALKAIDATGAGMALIVDAERRLIGALSDGDLRRALIRGAGLEDPAIGAANRAIARRSLVAARPIAAGEPFSLDNLAAKRPADGLSPMAIWPLLGQVSPRAYVEDEAIEA